MSTYTDADTDTDTDASSPDAQMPDRYRPDPVTTAAVSRAWRSRGSATSGRPSAKMPTLALRDWLDVNPPTTLPIAPRDDGVVRVGRGVPSILDGLTVSLAGKDNREYPTATFALSVLEYLGAEPGDRLVVERVADDTLEVSVREDT